MLRFGRDARSGDTASPKQSLIPLRVSAFHPVRPFDGPLLPLTVEQLSSGIPRRREEDALYVDMRNSNAPLRRREQMFYDTRDAKVLSFNGRNAMIVRVVAFALALTFGIGSVTAEETRINDPRMALAELSVAGSVIAQTRPPPPGSTSSM
jgi:hypothetical protein